MGAPRVPLALAALLAALLLAAPTGTQAQLNPAILDAIKDNPIIMEYVARVVTTPSCQLDPNLLQLDFLQCPQLIAWFDAMAANATELPRLTCEPSCRTEFSKLTDPCFFGLQDTFFADGASVDQRDIGNTYLHACFGRNTPSATVPTREPAPLNPNIVEASYANPLVLRFVTAVRETRACSNDTAMTTVDINQCPSVLTFLSELTIIGAASGAPTCEDSCQREYAKLSAPCIAGIRESVTAVLDPQLADVGSVYLSACFGTAPPQLPPSPASGTAGFAPPAAPNIEDTSANLELLFLKTVRETPACSNDTAVMSVDVKQCPSMLAFLAKRARNSAVSGALTCEDSCRHEYDKLSARCIADLQKSLLGLLDPCLSLPGEAFGGGEASGNGSSSSLSGGAIAGTVAGSLVAVGALMAAVLVLRRRRRASKQAVTHTPLENVASFEDDKEKARSSELEGKAPRGSSHGNDRGAPPAKRGQPQPEGNLALGSNSQHSLESDPILSFIASHMNSAALGRHLSDAATPTQGRDRHISPITSYGSSSGAMMSGMAQWAVDWEEIHVQRFIGRGSCGRVYLALWRETQVAAKVLLTSDQLAEGMDSLELPQSTLRELHKEAQLLSRIRHPHIVSFMGLCSMPPCILTEYCPHGSVYEMLVRAKRGQLERELTWDLRLRMVTDAATGLHYLHSCSPPVLHRDVKSPNLLVDESFRVKVTDFNLSKLLQQENMASDSSAGATNPTWLAPEVLAGSKATTATDVYAFGLVMYELLTWQLPWSTSGPSYRTVQLVLRGDRPPLPPVEELPGNASIPPASLEQYCQLMRECWAQEPEERPSLAAVVPRLRAMLGQLQGSSSGKLYRASSAAASM